MPNTTRLKDKVIVEIDRETRMKLKILASLEAQTMQGWLRKIIANSYELKLRANGKIKVVSSKKKN